MDKYKELPDFIKSQLQSELFNIEANNSMVLIQNYYQYTLSQVNLIQFFSINSISDSLFQISKLISDLHQLSIVHGNIKPSNILITVENKYLLSDYFQNQLYIDSNENNLQDINDKRYLSPEMIQGKEYNTKTDIWSLGCLIYFILSGGKHLFSESMELSLFYNITNCKYELLKIEKYSDEINELLNKLICKEEEKRLNIEEVIEEMKRNEKLLNDIKYIENTTTNIKLINRNKRSISPTLFQNIPIIKKETPKTDEKVKGESNDISHLTMVIKGKLIMYYKVDVLDLNNCNISDVGMQILYDNIIKQDNNNNNNSNNKQILLQNNNISDKGFVLLLDMLEYCPGLKILNLSHNHISSQCFDRLEKSVRFMVDLEMLDLSCIFYLSIFSLDNEIKVSSLDVLKKILKNMKHLRVLDISKNRMTETDIENFTKKIQSISEFEHLEIK